jgi:hypothetical protein
MAIVLPISKIEFTLIFDAELRSGVLVEAGRADAGERAVN